MKRVSLLFFFLVLAVGMMAQSSSFTVLAKSGSVLSGSSDVKIGQVLGADQITLAANAYLGLISSNGKPIELNKAGTYSTEDLMKMLGNSEGTFSEQFVSFMASEMNDDGEDYKAGLGVTGSVERAIGSNKLFIPLPKKSKFIGTEMFVQWLRNDTKLNAKYTLEIMNMSEEVLYTKQVNDSETVINPYDIKALVSGDLYLLRINENGTKMESNVVCFYLPSIEENKEICNELDTLLGAKSTTLECIAAAQMLSEKGFHLAALQKYQQALATDQTNAAKNSFSAYVNSIK